MNNSFQTYSVAQLKGQPEKPAAPFWLALPDDNQTWLCQQLLRWLPGKRVVMHLQRDSSELVCKLFFRHRDFERETIGHRWLNDGAIATPAIVKQIENSDAGWWMIFYQYVAGETLEELAIGGDTAEHRRALENTVSQVGRMHRAGLRQIDIHLGNFIFNQTIQVVDSAAVSKHGAPLSGKLAAENLGDLFAQYSLENYESDDSLWQHYLAGWPSPNWPRSQLRQAVRKMRELRWQHYRGKLCRQCSEFNVIRHWRLFRAWRQDCDSTDFGALLDSLDSAIEGGRYLKQGNTATLARVEHNDRSLVIKRYNIKNWRHALSRCWRPSRAWQSWHNAYYLLFIGLQTPRPLALVEHRLGWLRGKAYLVSEFSEGVLLKDYVEQTDASGLASIIEAMAKILNCYYDAGISHGDMKADNFLVNRGKVIITDLDPMRHHRQGAKLQAALKRDINRLLTNWSGEKQATIKTLLARHLRPELEV